MHETEDATTRRGTPLDSAPLLTGVNSSLCADTEGVDCERETAYYNNRHCRHARVLHEAEAPGFSTI